jgi:response regulator RpfG family c-di-GMP phosphodiesterase
MSDATPDQNFLNYKKAEKKALELLAEMKAASTNKVDIELALLVAIFELHKDTAPAATISSIIQGHLKQLVPHYGPKTPGGKQG